MNRLLDCIQIWYGCSLGISDDLINFLDESIKNKILETHGRGGGGIFFHITHTHHLWREDVAFGGCDL